MEIVYREESYAIIGACFEVYKEKRSGFLEGVYQECLAIEFELQGIPFTTQLPIALHYKERPLQVHYVADFIVSPKSSLSLKPSQI
jgi:GxxExxY protein